MMDAIPPDPIEPSGAQRGFAERVIGALKLDARVYDEVEHDPGALGQAAGVIALGALARGLGTVGLDGGATLVWVILSAFGGWLFSTAIVWVIGVRVFGHSSDYPELLRTLGFASAPSLLLAIGILPIGPLRVLLVLGVQVLTVFAWVIAVRQALDVSTGRAVWVCILAVGVSVLLTALLVGGGALRP
jgi:hypothetical protein